MNWEVYNKCLSVLNEYDKDLIKNLRKSSEDKTLRRILNWFKIIENVDVEYLFNIKEINIDIIKDELLDWYDECSYEVADYDHCLYDEVGKGTTKLLLEIYDDIEQKFDENMMLDMCGFNQKIDYNCGNLNILKRFNIIFYNFIYRRNNNLNYDANVYELEFAEEEIENNDLEIYLMRSLRDENVKYIKNKFHEEIEYLIKDYANYEFLSDKIELLKTI